MTISARSATKEVLPPPLVCRQQRWGMGDAAVLPFEALSLSCMPRSFCNSSAGSKPLHSSPKQHSSSKQHAYRTDASR